MAQLLLALRQQLHRLRETERDLKPGLGWGHRLMDRQTKWWMAIELGVYIPLSLTQRMPVEDVERIFFNNS